ncbi:MAG: DUF4249 domain-containing protein [Dysgonamonadaceae bacterium]|jgi:hypothetical protein|nr:DUF4249 domain-containing protein [Dysgonamonadaceae bacterium]
MHKLLFCCLIGTLLPACTERIDILTDNAAQRLVIYGKISTEAQAHTVSITRSTGYFSTEKPEGVTDARVTLTGSDGTGYTLDHSENGNYNTPPGFSGQEGVTYHLEVTLDFDGDGTPETYEATSFLPPKATIKGLRVVPSQAMKRVMEIQLTVDLPEKQNGIPNAYNLHFFQNGKALNDSLKNFTIFDDEHIITQRLDTFACYYLFEDEHDRKLQPGDSIAVIGDVITKEYADFLTEAQQEIRGSIPLFSGPPADVRTNIRCREKNIPVAGFFTAFSQDKMTVVYHGD